LNISSAYPALKFIPPVRLALPHYSRLHFSFQFDAIDTLKMNFHASAEYFNQQNNRKDKKQLTTLKIKRMLKSYLRFNKNNHKRRLRYDDRI